MVGDGTSSSQASRRSGWELVATTATVLSAVAFAVLWFAVAALAIAVVVLSMLDA